MSGLCLALALVLSAAREPPAAAAAEPAGAGPAPAASEPTPATPPPRLKLDLQRVIDQVYTSRVVGGPPRFEEKLEVRDRAQDAADEHLAGIDEQCAESESGPPSHAELNRYRTHPVPVHWDYLALARFLFKTAKRTFASKEPRYFIYAVHRVARDGGPLAAAELVVREGRIDEPARTAAPGTTWELIESFRDRDEALRGLTRLRQGFASAVRAHADDRPPPWATTNCRPRRHD